jgi:thiamine-phosphate diphosphorylase
VSAFPRPAICLVTDRRRLSPGARTLRDELAGLDRLLDEAIEAGVDLIQIRERDLQARPLCEYVRALLGRLGGSSARVLVNERADVAIAAGAHGVHVRADGPRLDRVRSLDPRWILGRSVHQGDRIDRRATADYLIFGPVFATGSKPGARPSGLDALAALAGGTPAAVLAIGGITPARAASCVTAGAAGVAAIGLFLPAGREPGALGSAQAVRALRAAMLE